MIKWREGERERGTGFCFVFIFLCKSEMHHYSFKKFDLPIQGSLQKCLEKKKCLFLSKTTTHLDCVCVCVGGGPPTKNEYSYFNKTVSETFSRGREEN